MTKKITTRQVKLSRPMFAAIVEQAVKYGRDTEWNLDFIGSKVKQDLATAGLQVEK